MGDTGRLALPLVRYGGVGESVNEVANPAESVLRRNIDQMRERFHLLTGQPLPTLATFPTAATVNLEAIREQLDQVMSYHELPMQSVGIVRNGRRTRNADVSVNMPTLTPEDTTYDLIVQQSRAQSVHYGRGIRNRWPSTRTRYRPDREIPLSCQDACRCDLFPIEVAIHRPWGSVSGYQAMQAWYRDERRLVRRQALGDAGLFSTMSDRALVELRQARALAGIDVSEYDVEITRRILADPSGWGAVASVMRRRGWVDEVLNEGENYVLR